ncbi:MAG TPA: hypothetical protein VF247_05815 [Candidatus Krumholzibacteria bacterium]
MKTIGILLIAIGLIGVIWGGVTYVRDRDTAHVGPISLSVENKDRVSIPPAFGATALVLGGVLVIMSRRKRARVTI